MVGPGAGAAGVGVAPAGGVVGWAGAVGWAGVVGSRITVPGGALHGMTTRAPQGRAAAYEHHIRRASRIRAYLPGRLAPEVDDGLGMTRLLVRLSHQGRAVMSVST